MSLNKKKDPLARYRARYRVQDLCFSMVNKALSPFFRRGDRAPVPDSPRRILVANAGLLGDAILSTAVFPVLRHAFPEASLDFLGSSASRPVMEGHPLLDRAFYLDHWRVSRSLSRQLAGMAPYYARVPSEARKLRAQAYDMALDLHAWHPNYLLLFWLAGIPVRAGFGRTGGEAMLTHPAAFTYDRRHEVESYLDVLRAVGVGEASLGLAKPSFRPATGEELARAAALTASCGRYRILHPGSSTPIKDWTIEGWAELAQRLADRGITPVITGSGDRDAALAKQIADRERRCVSIVNVTPWPVLMAVLQGAELVYSVDTSVGHAARVLGRPVVSIYGGMTDPMRWAPVGAHVATHSLPCSPCYDKRGCATRACLTQLSVDDVELAAEQALSDPQDSNRITTGDHVSTKAALSHGDQ